MFYMKKNSDSDSGLFDDFTNFFSNSFSRMGNILRTDIIEEENQYIMFVEVPGVEKKNIAINVEDEHLNISILPCEKEDNRNYIRKERKFETAVRRFYMGSVDENEIKAKITNGVLRITVPKKQEQVTSKKLITIE